MQRLLLTIKRAWAAHKMNTMHARSGKPPNGHRRSLTIALAIVSCAAAVAACGSSGQSSSGATAPAANGYGTKLNFSECMRSHGVPDFPDPRATGGPSNSFDGISLPSGIDLQAPAFQAAVRSCKQVLSSGAPPPRITESEKLAALGAARCIRRHGFPKWPDPTFSNNEIGISTGGIDVRSPAFKRAQAACRTR